MADQTMRSRGVTATYVDVVILRLRGDDATEEFFAVPIDLIRTYKLGSTDVRRVRPLVEGKHKEILDGPASWAAVATATGEWQPALAVNQAALGSIGQAFATPGPGRSVRCAANSMMPPTSSTPPTSRSRRKR